MKVKMIRKQQPFKLLKVTVIMEECYFKLHSSSLECKQSHQPLYSAGIDRVKTIINSSKRRCDNLHLDLQERLNENPNLSLVCHRSCVSSYTSNSHIQRHLKRHGGTSENTSEAPPKKRTRLSESCIFNFQDHCIFCGKACVLNKDSKNPSRWRKALMCRTSDRGPNNKTFKQVILDVCHSRNDEWAWKVQVRVQGAISDLHAMDARYHDDCRVKFMAPRSVHVAAIQCQGTCENFADAALEALVKVMKFDKARVWTSNELFKVYKDHEGTLSSKYALVRKLSELFDRSL